MLGLENSIKIKRQLVSALKKKNIPCALQGATVVLRLFPEVSLLTVATVGSDIATSKMSLTHHSQQVTPSKVSSVLNDVISQ